MMTFQRIRFWLRGWATRLRVLFGKGSMDAELEEELRFHLEQTVAENLRAGMSGAEARRQAHIAFGGVERFKEQVREQRGGRGLDELSQDLRYAFRSLRRRPGFALIAVGILGMGIGASTTLFSAVNGVLLRPLSYQGSERLLQVGLTRGEDPRLRGFQMPQLLDLMERARNLDSVIGSRGGAFDLVGEGEPERVTVSRVTPGFFRTLGAPPPLGRSFHEDEFSPLESPVAVVSHGLWQRRWGGRSDIIGHTFQASEEFVEGVATYTIVGVAPPGFVNPAPLDRGVVSPSPGTQIWMPLSMDPAVYSEDRWYWRISVLGKIRGEVSPGEAIQDLSRLGTGLALEFPERYRLAGQPLGLGAAPLLDVTVGSRRRDLLILLGATGLLLLIACANVAGLLLARASDRGREMGIRSAMGAGTRRLVRQLLTESMVLGALGGLLGVGLSFVGVWAFRALGPTDFPRLTEVGVDLRALLFGLGTALLAGLLFGLAPALLSSRTATSVSLRENDRGSTGPRGLGRLRGGLVAAEVALALVLLTGSGLLFRSLMSLNSVDPGMDPQGLVMMQVNLPASYTSPEERVAFFSGLSGSLAALPGARAVSFTENPPMGSNLWFPWVWREGEEERQPRQAAGHTVGPEYFRTLGIQILRGRAFGPQDDENGVPVAIVNETMAREIWPGEDPLGKGLDFGPRSERPPMTVVGISREIRQTSLADERAWEMYLPYSQRPESPRAYMLVRAGAESGLLAGAMRQAVWEMDGNLPVPEITTMEARVAATLQLPRFRTFLLGSFAFVALLLAAAGIYGTMLYVVGRRTREVGIRMALGAEAREVVAMMIRQGVGPVGAGLAMGLMGSLAATRLLSGFLFGVTPADPLTFLAVTGGLGGLAVLATFVPARRAALADPMEVLREE